jgi:hypothetical protein
MSHRFLAVTTAAALLALPAGAVIIDSGDGTGNTSAPAEDPGWVYVGLRGNWTAVYLRNRWVLTANHVTTGPVELDGVVYDPVPGSDVRLDNGDGTYADLKLFAIDSDPGLPDLPIRASTNLPTRTVILIGHGRDRGAATDSDDPSVWVPPPDPPDPPIPGFKWAGTITLRWGENTVSDYWPGDPYNTVAFYTVFDPPGSPDHTAHTRRRRPQAIPAAPSSQSTAPPGSWPASCTRSGSTRGRSATARYTATGRERPTSPSTGMTSWRSPPCPSPRGRCRSRRAWPSWLRWGVGGCSRNPHFDVGSAESVARGAAGRARADCTRVRKTLFPAILTARDANRAAV